ncbi:MAG: FkbM family methyltransferase [Candidatus Methylacidiphilaceae bacterium]
MDIGANVGVMSSLMAFRAGPRGKVVALEAHPLLFGELQENIRAWSRSPQFASFEPIEAAATSEDGWMELKIPEGFATNRGTASVEASRSGAKAGGGIRIRAVRWDTIGAGRQVGVIKLDVEGHELSVLQGAENELGSGRIRDIFLECHPGSEPRVVEILEATGYSVFRSVQRQSGPVLLALDPPGENHRELVATREPQRLLERFEQPGWGCLRP